MCIIVCTAHSLKFSTAPALTTSVPAINSSENMAALLSSRSQSQQSPTGRRTPAYTARRLAPAPKLNNFTAKRFQCFVSLNHETMTKLLRDVGTQCWLSHRGDGRHSTVNNIGTRCWLRSGIRRAAIGCVALDLASQLCMQQRNIAWCTCIA